MDQNSVLLLIGATTILVAIPGPNVALIVANTIAHGFRFGATTVIGTTLGVAFQLFFVVLGLATLVEYAATALTWLKWMGVAYLLFLGFSAWRQGIEDLHQTSASEQSLNTLFWQGLLLATVNPKTLLFNAAFLSQFIGADANSGSVLTAAAVFLGVLFLGDLVWAGTAHSVRPLIFKLGRLRHRLTGCFFFAAGAGLALARVNR